VIEAQPYNDTDNAPIVQSIQQAKPSASLPPATQTPISAAPGSSATVSVAPVYGVQTVYGAYVPYRLPQGTEHSPEMAKHSSPTEKQPATTGSGAAATFDPDANIVTEETAGRADQSLLNGPTGEAVEADPDAGIVIDVSSHPGEVPDGTLVKVKLHEDLSTMTTRVGTSFTAEVSDPVTREGQVVVPVGSMLEGRVTLVRGGKRVGGSAAIHLEARTITLPDGSQYLLHARVIDTSSWDDTKVDSEGTILRKDHAKGTSSAIGLSAGAGMAAGAMLGGVPGALIGAGVGAGVSTAVWLRQDCQANLPKDLGIVFSLTEPMRVTPMSARLARPGAGSVGAE
jgi:hypothetical protein